MRAALRAALLLVAASSWLATSASAFAFLTPVTTPCQSCPGGVAFDVAASYLANPRWTAGPATHSLQGGLLVWISPGMAGSFGVSDPELAAKIEATIASGVLAWSSPVISFDIVLGGVAPSGTDISIGSGFTQSIGGRTDFSTAYSLGRQLTNGEILPGTIFTGAVITLNQSTLTNMFSLIGESFALAALQRLVAHEMGHALGLGHPTDVYQYNVVNDSSAGLIVSPDAVDDTAIMVPFSSLPGLHASFDPTMRLDDLAGRDVLYPAPEPAGLLLAAVGALAGGIVRRALA